MKNYLLPLLHFLLVIICFIILMQSRSTEAILSPWQVVPQEFFIIYFLASLALIASILFINNIQHVTRFALPITLLQVSLHTFLTASVAATVYQIGYGFDPFIHRATEKMLIETGTISPKPFMYIGQYSLVVILHHLTQIPLALIDKFLVPVFGSFFLPPIIYHGMTIISIRNGNDKLYIFNPYKLHATSYKLLSSLLPLLLPFSFLIVTVPQNLAIIFLVILVFLSIPLINSINLKSEISNLSHLWFLALITLFIHPLAGIPALIYVVIFSFSMRQKGVSRLTLIRVRLLKKLFLVSCFLFLSIIIPLFFLIASRISPELEVTINWQSSFAFFPFSFFTYIPFHSLLHTAYLYEANTLLIFSILTTIGLWTLFKTPRAHDTLKNMISHPLIATFLILCANIFFLSFLSFSSLPGYEQREFLDRLWQIALIFLLPFFCFGFLRLLNSVREQPISKILLFLIPCSFFLANMYFWYPRVDELAPKARGFSVSATDIEAVRWIEKDAAEQDYIVLANQSVSAAALQVLGFKKYYKRQNDSCHAESRFARILDESGLAEASPITRNDTLPQSQCDNTKDIFFYPIPTGGPLYELYLKMVYEAPDRATVEESMALTGVSRAYFVLNDYWLDAPKIKSAAQAQADEIFEIINHITIFSYKTN